MGFSWTFGLFALSLPSKEASGVTALPPLLSSGVARVVADTSFSFLLFYPIYTLIHLQLTP